MSEIFISHSSKDKDLVEIFVNDILDCGIGISSNDIFCTSIEGLGIKSGEDWRKAINENLIGAKVIILFLTPNYKESEICLNEMGAAWAINAEVIPIIVSPINYEKIGVLFNIKQGVDLMNPAKLDNLRDVLYEKMPIEKLGTERWNAQKQKAIFRLGKIITSNPFPTSLSRDKLLELEKELKEKNEAFKSILEENLRLDEYCQKLEKLKNQNDVRELKKEVGLLDDYELFCEKCKNISKLLNRCDIVVRRIIFNHYTYNNIPTEEKYYSKEVANDIATKLIDEELELNFNHPEIKEISDEIEEFKAFYSKKISENTNQLLLDKYPNILLEFDSLDLWETFFKIKIR